MARFHLALLLLFIAVSAVIVTAAVDKPSTTTSEAPTAKTPTDGGGNDVAEGPGDSNAIGTTDDDTDATPGDDDVAVAGPIGSDSSYENYPPPQQASGSCATATIGFVSFAAVTVGSLFFS